MIGLKLSKLVALALYHTVAKHIPTIAGLPDAGGRMRSRLCRTIFGSCGNNLEIAGKVDFGQGQRLHVGDDVVIERGVQINLNDDVFVGNGTFIGEETIIYTQDHGHFRKDIPMQQQPYHKKPVSIGDNAAIGPRTIIVKGVVIEAGAIVDPGSVVTGHVAAGTRVAGVPAKPRSDAA